MQLKLEGVARYWQEGQSTALVQGVNLSLRAAKGNRLDSAGWRGPLGNETTTNADGVFVNLLGPEALEIDADRGKNRDVKDGEKRVRQSLGGRKVQGDAAKAKIHNTSALSGLIAEDGVRVSMAGTNAYAVLGDQAAQRARVVDLGFGGVALDFPTAKGLPDTLLAVLHVPILPPVRVNLKRLWTKQINEDTVRVGCCFIS